ncbi:MAG: AAA family ATPase, partial [FCB group bacterium]|nr:AAA family ATPase [FCB group bacterium]
MKLPYGISNFAELRTEGYFYVDKTRYIELLEAAPEKYPVMLRSRRFGKTLFCNMLSWYYDRLCEDRFAEVFQGSYIHKRPTPRRHTYMMLTFNFSGINTETLENANEGFASEVRRNVKSFMKKYRDHFSEAEREQLSRDEKPNEMLSTLFQTVQD